MRRPFHAILACFLALLASGACADDSAEREEIVINIQGTWSLEATLHQDQGGATCQVTDLTLTIRMQGNTRLFGGETSGGRISCTGGVAGPLEAGLPVLTVGTGIQDKGSEVSFNLSRGGTFEGDDTFLELDGNLSASRMEGEVKGFVLLEDLGGAVAFEGTFVNRRI